MLGETRLWQAIRSNKPRPRYPNWYAHRIYNKWIAAGIYDFGYDEGDSGLNGWIEPHVSHIANPYQAAKFDRDRRDQRREAYLKEKGWLK